ncbi:LOW QUALITY PROTEIN: hypothetical protein MAR_004408 [Mya arenaria]|uniref:C2H2-type domain-containing protein n=1 Tax=Mya arenaria TaxID=6604 RepID=A0ABY7F0M5_MYAAR|nr:LOW QUALITY PROTEIN: hypothetical protein MAR_004408 [Mya arenaria]
MLEFNNKEQIEQIIYPMNTKTPILYEAVYQDQQEIKKRRKARASCPAHIKRSQRSFKRLKPFYVSPVRSGDRNNCLCIYHVELKAVFDCCMKNDPSLTSNYPNYYVGVKLESEDHHNISCQKCGVDNFKMLEQETGDETTELEQFEYVTVSSKGIQVSKKTDAEKKDDKCESDAFIFHATSCVISFTSRDQLKHLTTNLHQNDCAVVHDFSENYRQLKSQPEITIHVSILYRYALLEIDGVDSTKESPNIALTEQFIV